MMRRLAALTLLALLGLALAELYFALTHYRTFGTANLALLASGTVARPYVYRQLAAQAAVVLSRLTGLELARAGDVVVQAAMIGWLWSMYALARAGLSDRASLIAAVTAAAPVGLLWVSGGYIYDMPHLALFTLALALMAHGKRALYLALFPLVVYSKETALLLVGVYWLLARQDRRGLAVQLAAFALVRGALMLRFAGNPGAALETHPMEHIAWVMFYPQPNLLALAVFGGGLLAARQHWDEKHPAWRAAALTLPVMFVAYFLFGYPGEIRAVLEAYPALYVLSFHTVWTRAAVPTYQWVRRLGSAQPATPSAQSPAT